MGSIINRDGRWRAQVRRKGFPNQCRTFATKAAAAAWVRKLEGAIESGESTASLGDTTVGDVIRAYRRLREEGGREIRDDSNEHYMLKALERGLALKLLAKLVPDDLVAYAAMRRDEGAGPYTVNMDVSKLGTVLRYGSAKLRISPPDVVGAARPLLTHLRLIGGGGKRERRPTEDELRRVLDHLAEKYGAVYAEAVAFAAVSAMRRGEVCRIGFEDIDEAKRVIPVWRKHPRRGKVLEHVPLLPAAWEIIQRQPRGEPEEVMVMTDRGEVLARKTRIFPIHDRTLSKYFTDTCSSLGIPDLHLHDMRHEGTSALFEQGYDIHQVALVTGHKDWRHLKRYTQLKPESLTQPVGGEPPGGQPRRGSQRSAGAPQGTSSQGRSPRSVD